jgi:hypothetical protein
MKSMSLRNTGLIATPNKKKTNMATAITKPNDTCTWLIKQLLRL